MKNKDFPGLKKSIESRRADTGGHPYRFALMVLAMVLALAFSEYLAAAEPMAVLEEDVLGILKARFPDAVLTRQLDGTAVFRQQAREFMVYRLDKMGNWQTPGNEFGPDRGGLVVEFCLRKEPWSGSAGIPVCSTEDLYVFKETTFIRASADGAGYIWARILTPVMDPPGDLQNLLIKHFTDFADVWGRSIQFSQGELDHMSYPETTRSLEEIKKCGQLAFISPGQSWCVLIWYSPFEGIGFGDAVIYRRRLGTWSIQQAAKHILLPEVRNVDGRVLVTRQAHLNTKRRVRVFSIEVKKFALPSAQQ